MVDLEAIRAPAAGTPPGPARVVVLDSASCPEVIDGPARALAEARASGCRATLRLSGPCDPARALELLAALGEWLAAAGLALAPEAVALPAAATNPAELVAGADAACGARPSGYLMLPGTALEAVQRRRPVLLADGSENDGRSWWGRLLALAASNPGCSLVPEAPGPGVSRLAPGGAWAGPAPGSGELIPARARRLRLELDFRALVEASGDDPVALGRLAGELVTRADARLADQPGTGPRRLALQPEGIAAAVVARGRDPRSFGALCWVKSRLAAFRDGACAASVRLAREQGAGGGLEPFPLPGRLEVAEAGPRERAVLVHGARHSHLVCLSPWSLAPPGFGRDAFGLLPALACADSISWRRPEEEHPLEWYDEALRFAWAVALRG